MKFNKLKSYIKNYNLLDIIGVSIFLVILAIAFIFFLRKYNYVKVTVRITDVESVFNWEHSKIPAWYIENLKPGIEKKDPLGRIILKLEDVYYYPSYEENQTVYATLKVGAVYNKRINQYTFNGTPLLVGNYQEFDIQNVNVSGIIHNVRNYDSQIETKNLVVRGELEPQNNEEIIFDSETQYKGIKKYISKLIQKDLEVKDSRDSVIAKILTAKKSPAYRQAISNGRLAQVIDPDREKVDLELLVTAQIVNGKYFFREETPIVVNEILRLDFDKFFVEMTITDIEEVEE